MRQKLLLLVMMFTFGVLNAQTYGPQDTVWTVIISEARIDRADHAYIELTNIGTEAINLQEFELVSHSPWNALPAAWPAEPSRPDGRWALLPDHVLQPGEQYIIASLHDYYIWHYNYDMANFGYSRDYGQGWVTKPELTAMTDFPVHRGENPEAGTSQHDSVSTHSGLFDTWNGRDVVMLRHYPAEADSCVVDQVGGTWTGNVAEGALYGTNNVAAAKDVAGETNATNHCTLVRRSSVTKGNKTFVQGNSISESEWIPIPVQRGTGDTFEPWKSLFWTAGNHGNVVLDNTTLTSDIIDIDWDNEVLNVPYWVRNDDSIMYEFTYQPGLAWHYHYSTDDNSSMDSLLISVATGDSLTIYACGDLLDEIKWHINKVAPPTNANLLVPARRRNLDGSVGGPVYAVTNRVTAGDTIYNVAFGERTDSLVKYLEAPPAATLEFIWVDGNERTDVMNGDILRVTAEDGTSVKDYFIKVQKFRKDRNAYLSAITWPDIPEFYKGLFGWVGDTIPEFNRTKLEYKVMVPYDVDGIPALVAKNEDNNATSVLKRATNMSGSPADRTVTIITTAEDDTTTLTYNVLLEKQKNQADIQPWQAEPFISQWSFRIEYGGICMLEIVNPGNQPLDMSDYMIAFGNVTSAADALAIGGGETGYSDYRYRKYIPGYLWKDHEGVIENHSFAELDPNVSTYVYGNDVFVMAKQPRVSPPEDYIYFDQIDVDFYNMKSDPDYKGESLDGWLDHTMFLFKIIGDSIKDGLKAATDPDDFVLLDVFGNGDGTTWLPIGETSTGQVTSYTRKADIYKGDPDFAGSFADTPEDSEWLMNNESLMQNKGYGWPNWRTEVPQGTGSHFMNDVTIYRSTVSSTVYAVSAGYSMEETIAGVDPGTTVEGFKANIIKAQAEQTLECIALADGSMLNDADVLLDGDTLKVTSAELGNVTKYILTVASFSDDAVLTSTNYTVAVNGAAGSVAGMEYGTTLKQAIANVVVPTGATMTPVNGMDEFIPLITVDFDTMYVDVQVSDDVFLEVIAEDGVTTIKYQVIPNADATSAFVISDVYAVDQDKKIVGNVPENLNIEAFLANLTPAPGATLQLYDKLGYERNDGMLTLDDVLEVTAQDGTTKVVYTLKVMSVVESSLAYVYSTVYTVDGLAKSITGEIYTSTTVSDFKANLTASDGATMVVQAYDGTAKADADMMEEGDLVEVTASNGVNINVYTVEVMVGIFDTNSSDISIYPNPSNGVINIAGAEYGSFINVVNMVGATVAQRQVQKTVETISLEGLSSGIYFVSITNGSEVSGQYKVLKY